MNRTVLLFFAALYKDLLIMRRYIFNTVSQIITFYALFAIMFFGGRQVAGPSFTGSIGGIIVGYFLWLLIMNAYSSIASDITNEAEWGTLEQLYMSPLGISRVLGIMTIVNILIGLTISVLVLSMIIITVGISLEIDLVTVIPMIVLSLAPAVGLGYLFGGLALLYKRIEEIFGLMQFVFVGLLAAPVEQVPILKLLPFTQGSYLLRKAMTEGKSLFEIAIVELGILVGVGLFYFVVGYIAFQRIQRIARYRGVMGDY